MMEVMHVFSRAFAFQAVGKVRLVRQIGAAMRSWASVCQHVMICLVDLILCAGTMAYVWIRLVAQIAVGLGWFVPMESVCPIWREGLGQDQGLFVTTCHRKTVLAVPAIVES